MKKSLIGLSFMCISAFAVDYSAMSATELAAMRGTVPVEDRAAFQAAMQEKMQTMSQEERQALSQSRTSNPGNMGARSGNANGVGGGMGMGGNGMGGGRGGR